VSCIDVLNYAIMNDRRVVRGTQPLHRRRTKMTPANKLTRRAALTAALPALVLPAASSAAESPEALRPLPEVGQPAEQVLAALVAWMGGPHAAAAALAVELESWMSVGPFEDSHYGAVRPRLEARGEWAGEYAYEAAAAARIAAACERFGYGA
jgi:hypothetical protein